MNKLEMELEEIFDKNKDRSSDNHQSETGLSDFKDSITAQFKDAANFLNNKYESNMVGVLEVTNNFLSLLFNVENGEGLLISFGKTKLVLVLFEEDNFLTFIGRSEGSQGKNIKLLRLSVIEKDNKYLLKDNSGVKVRTEEVIVQIIKWGID